MLHTLSASQGLTEEAAIEKYTDVDVYTTSFRPMRNTVSGSPLRTFMKIVVDAKTDVVVGCHMVGDHAAEIMQVGVLAFCELQGFATQFCPCYFCITSPVHDRHTHLLMLNQSMKELAFSTVLTAVLVVLYCRALPLPSRWASPRRRLTAWWASTPRPLRSL